MVTKINDSYIETLLTFNQNPNAIVWICSADYKEQYYLAERYETLWGHSREQFLNNPLTWRETLYPEDKSRIVDHIGQRAELQNQTTMFFRVLRADGNIQYVKDINLFIYNNYGQIQAIAGVAEILPESLWRQQQKNSISSDTLRMILSKLQNESCKPIDTQKKKRKHISLPLLQSSGNIILTKQEAICLYHMMKGHTAKQTANLIHRSYRTVETHLDQIRFKTQSKTKYEILTKVDPHTCITICESNL